MTAQRPLRGDVTVLVPAAGLGTRLGPGGPKALFTTDCPPTRTVSASFTGQNGKVARARVPVTVQLVAAAGPVRRPLPWAARTSETWLKLTVPRPSPVTVPLVPSQVQVVPVAVVPSGGPSIGWFESQPPSAPDAATSSGNS